MTRHQWWLRHSTCQPSYTASHARRPWFHFSFFNVQFNNLCCNRRFTVCVDLENVNHDFVEWPVFWVNGATKPPRCRRGRGIRAVFPMAEGSWRSPSPCRASAALVLLCRGREGVLSLLTGQGPTCLSWRHGQPTSCRDAQAASGRLPVHTGGVTLLLQYKKVLVKPRVIFTVRDFGKEEGNVYKKDLADQDWVVV